MGHSLLRLVKINLSGAGARPAYGSAQLGPVRNRNGRIVGHCDVRAPDSRHDDANFSNRSKPHICRPTMVELVKCME